MYSTSQAYKTAIRAASRPYNTVYGTLTFADGTTMAIDGSVLPSNSLSISKQCIDDDELMFGGVFTSVLKISILTDLERYAFYGASIDLTFKIQTGVDDTGETPVPIFEEVPLGIYTVADAERPNDRVTLTCYDNMTILNKQLGGTFLTGMPWEMFQAVSANTGIELDFDETDLESFPNHTYQSDASEERGIHTYRDVVKMVCQLLGCFAYASRDGKLAIKGFSITADTSLTMSDWFSLVPADYKCKYVGISISSLSGTYTKHTSSALDQGLVMIVEDAPAWDYGSEEAQQAKTDNLFNHLQLIDEYTPVDMDMPSDPSFDCGDRLELITRNGTIYTLITSIEWKFHQGMTIDSEGLNPYLEGSSVLASESNRILTQAIERSKLQFIAFTNPRQTGAGDLETVKIGECLFNPSAKTDALFVATILVDVSVPDVTHTETEEVSVPVKAYYNEQETTITDINGHPVSLTGTAENTYTYVRDGRCEIDFFYTLNSVRVPSNEEPYLATEKVEGGKHIITVAYPITALEPNMRYEFEIYMTVRDGTVTIPARTLQASIVGQELTDISGFTGLISIEDGNFFESLAEFGILAMSDEAEITLTNVPFINVTDNLLVYNIDSVEVQTLAEGTGTLQPQIFLRGGFDFATETGDYIGAENGYRFTTE